MNPIPEVRLVRRPAAPAGGPVLDADQQAVVDHAAGPLLVLAGPGTGKTTTIVESVVARVDAGIDPERILVLTFGRRAAVEVRERVTARLDRTIREPLARTFHSYAFGVLRREAARTGGPTPRLLSGAEQDLLVRELLRGETDGARSSGWPPALRSALLTRGFAQQVRDLLARCTERGIDAPALARLARLHDRPDWAAVARFAGQYADVSALAAPAAYAPSELVRAVVDRFDDPAEDLLARERGAYDWVFVDEFQDTDPAQVLLLTRLVPPGGNLVAVGDPNQSIYGFRGADVGALRRFPETFGTPSTPAAEVVLRTCRRSAPAVVTAAAAVAARLRGPHTARSLHAVPGRPPGSVDVHLAGSAAQEAALVAGILRRAHAVDGVPWGRMAVLLRTTKGRLGGLRRALLAAGVPAGVAAAELPLAEQPALRPLLDVYATGLRPDRLDEATAEALVTGPLGGLDPVGWRRLRRSLGGRQLAAALLDPTELADLPAHVAGSPRRVAALIDAVRRAAAAPAADAETVLWALWEATGLGPRWQAASLAGGPRGALADRDLDAVMALFDRAGRFVDRLPPGEPTQFLDHVRGQEIPADSLAAQTPPGDVVRLLTAHAAKGLEWDLVVVAGVQEGVWPDLRLRGSLLGAERLVELAGGPEEPPATPGALLEEERRLFYVALTRARERLMVTAVAGGEEQEAPSRFLADLPLGADEDARVSGRTDLGTRAPGEHTTLAALRRNLPTGALAARLREIAADPAQRPATRRRAGEFVETLAGLARSMQLSALVGELRAAVGNPAEPAPVRRAAAAQLARLAAAGVPGADPQEWYGLVPLSDERPLHDPGALVPVSPSTVERFADCPLRWLLEHVGGGGPAGTAQGVGTAVHAVAARSASGLGGAALRAALDAELDALDLGSPWHAAKLRQQAHAMLDRFEQWAAANDRDVVGVEVPFTLDVPAGAVTARVSGRVDRLERDAAGRAVVVDLKTGRSKPKDEQITHHPQLGVYQLAAEQDAFAAATGLRGAGGASLVQLGRPSRGAAQEQAQPALAQAEDPEWAARLTADAAAGMAAASFPAVENRWCTQCPVRTSCPLHGEGTGVLS